MSNPSQREIVIPFKEIRNYKIHESAEAYPLLSDEEQASLQEDIKANGQEHPVVVCKDQIYDGRNRTNAIRELKKALKAIVVSSEEEALQLAYSNNDKRRHMSKSQFAMKAAYRVLSSRTDKQGEKISQGKWLAVHNVEEVVNKIVSKRSVESALKVLQADKKIASWVFHGTIELSAALQKIDATQEVKEKKDDPNIKKLANDKAVEQYKSYIKSGKYTKEKLALKLVETETELAKLQKELADKN